MKKRIVAVLVTSFLLLMTGCGPVIKGNNGTTEGVTKIKLLTVGVTNVPVSNPESDPYYQYIKDEYGLDVTMMAYNANDFKQKITTLFAGKDAPDIVSFPNYDEFKKVYDQGVLIADWNPYLESMPLMSNVINLDPFDFKTPNPVKSRFIENDKLISLWTLPQPLKWVEFIRKDWVVELGYEEGWHPKTPAELLVFAEKVKQNKVLANVNGKSVGDPLCDIPGVQPYCFTSAGENKNTGMFGNFAIHMFGSHTWYLDEDNNLKHPILTGNYQKAFDFMKTVIDNEYINPNWLSYNFQDQQLTALNDQAAIVSFTSDIIRTTYQKHVDPSTAFTADETLDWWEVMKMPIAPGTDGGLQDSPGYTGKILTVSKAAAADQVKMQKITKLFNDVSLNYDYDKKGTQEFYIRGEAYDKLRWGVGIEEVLEFLPIEGTDKVYCNTSAPFGEDPHYRGNEPGAWDWGAWFNTTGDGVIEGKGVTEVNEVAYAAAAALQDVEQQPIRPQYYFLNPDPVKSLKNRDEVREFELTYILSGKAKTQAELDKMYRDFVKTWWTTHFGEDLFREIAQQFIENGYTVANANAQLSDFGY